MKNGELLIFSLIAGIAVAVLGIGVDPKVLAPAIDSYFRYMMPFVLLLFILVLKRRKKIEAVICSALILIATVVKLVLVLAN